MTHVHESAAAAISASKVSLPKRVDKIRLSSGLGKFILAYSILIRNLLASGCTAVTVTTDDGLLGPIGQLPIGVDRLGPMFSRNYE